MLRIRWAAPVLATALLAANGDGDRSVLISDWNRIQGRWTVLSVHRDGEYDALQVGAHMTFAGDEVAFKQQVAQIMDGTS